MTTKEQFEKLAQEHNLHPGSELEVYDGEVIQLHSIAKHWFKLGALAAIAEINANIEAKRDVVDDRRATPNIRRATPNLHAGGSDEFPCGVSFGLAASLRIIKDVSEEITYDI